MKKTRFTETQIVKALKEHEGGRSAEDICREMDISKGTLYNWKSKYGGMELSGKRNSHTVHSTRQIYAERIYRTI